MSRWRAFLAALLLAGPLASAAAPPAPPPGAAFRLAVEGAPGGALTAAWWTPPPEAVVPAQDGILVVPVEATLVLPPAAHTTRWAVIAFQPQDGALEPSLVRAEFARTLLRQTTPPSAPVRVAPAVAPFLAHVAFDARPGDPIAFVVALDAPQPVAAHLVFRPWGRDLAVGDGPHADPAAFLRSLAGVPIVDLDASGAGTGVHIGEYVDLGWSAPAPAGQAAWGGDVTVARGLPLDARPLAEAGTVEVATGMPGDAGWGVVVGIAHAATGAGAWSYAAEARGAAVDGAAPVVGHLDSPLRHATGVPIFSAMGDGDGPLRGRMRVEGAFAGAPRLVAFFAVGLGTPLEHLTGMRGATAATEEGLAGLAWRGEGHWARAGAPAAWAAEG